MVALPEQSARFFLCGLNLVATAGFHHDAIHGVGIRRFYAYHLALCGRDRQQDYVVLILACSRLAFRASALQ